jgi:hypothetical protein
MAWSVVSGAFEQAKISPEQLLAHLFPGLIRALKNEIVRQKPFENKPEGELDYLQDMLEFLALAFGCDLSELQPGPVGVASPGDELEGVNRGGCASLRDEPDGTNRGGRAIWKTGHQEMELGSLPSKVYEAGVKPLEGLANRTSTATARSCPGIDFRGWSRSWWSGSCPRCS